MLQYNGHGTMLTASMHFCIGKMHNCMGQSAVTVCSRCVIREIPGVTKAEIPAPIVTKKPSKRELTMNLALRSIPVQQIQIQVSSVDSRIRAFLAGDTNGEDVLHELYDDVLDEPIPERLRAVLKR